MRQPKRIFEDKRLGFLRARFVELKQEGARCPTYNLCPLDFYKFKETKRGKKQRSTNEKESLGIKLYEEESGGYSQGNDATELARYIVI